MRNLNCLIVHATDGIHANSASAMMSTAHTIDRSRHISQLLVARNVGAAHAPCATVHPSTVQGTTRTSRTVSLGWANSIATRLAADPAAVGAALTVMMAMAPGSRCVGDVPAI